MWPAPSYWERERSNLAGLFPLDTFTQLTALDLAVGGDASSEITLFGLSTHDERAQALYEALNRADRPDLSDILRAGEVFVDLAIVRDRFLGHTSYLTIKTIEPVDASVHRLAEHYNSAFRNYIDRLDQIRTLPDFHVAIDKMLAPPVREHS